MHIFFIFQVKHIRGILLDDAEKSRRTGGQSSSNKPPLIHLEINPIPVIQINEKLNTTLIASSTSGSNKNTTSKVSQDDSVINFKVSRDLSNRLGNE